MIESRIDKHDSIYNLHLCFGYLVFSVSFGNGVFYAFSERKNGLWENRVYISIVLRVQIRIVFVWA